MKTTHAILALVLSGTLVPIGAHWLPRGDADAEEDLHTLIRGPLTVRTSYEGEIESRVSTPVASRLNSTATIMELAPEGALVTIGDMLVRFDPSTMEHELINMSRDAALGRARLAELRDATQPLELDTLTVKRDEAITELEDARQLLEDTRSLRREDLVPEQEVTQQVRAVARLTRQLESLDRQLVWTRDLLHPSALERATAEAEAASRALERLQTQVADATVTATCAGVVVYLPLHLGGEFRTTRVGDTVYRNQPFLRVADMSNLVVNCYVPEAEMAQLRAGLTAEVLPLAFPDLHVPAVVESIGSMAHTVSGRPTWQKFLRLTLRLESADPRLRTGMTVRVNVNTYAAADAILLPRAAVQWTGDKPSCRVITRGDPRITALTLGQADDAHYEVLAGVNAGDQVLMP